jgi:hypothetical protein
MHECGVDIGIRRLARQCRPIVAGLLLVLLACAGRRAASARPARPVAHEPVAAAAGVAPAAAGEHDAALQAVAFVHGAAGPSAVAGYRMGQHALVRLGLPRGSWDLQVVHHAPRQVQYSCIADGAAAATGASLGRLNLELVEATAAAVRTTYRRRSTGRAITLRLTPGFIARFAQLPRAQLEQAGREVMRLDDAQIFSEVSGAAAGDGPSGDPGHGRRR